MVDGNPVIEALIPELNIGNTLMLARSTCDVEKITMLKDEQLEKSVLAKIRLS